MNRFETGWGRGRKETERRKSPRHQMGAWLCAWIYSIGWAYAAQAQVAFWAGADSFQRIDLTSGETKMLLESPISTPGVLAVDAANRRVYWFDQETMSIRRTDYEGVGSEVVVGSLPDPVLGLAVHHRGGHVFWTTSTVAEGGTIFRADLDGSNSEAFLIAGVGQALHSLALDPAGEWLYWTQSGLGDFVPRGHCAGSMRRIKLDGGEQETISAFSPCLESGLAVSADHVYFAECESRYSEVSPDEPFDGLCSVRAAALDGLESTILAEVTTIPKAIAVDEQRGIAYWTRQVPGPEAEADPHGAMLDAAALDGSSLSDFPMKLETVNGMAIDAVKGLVFWSEPQRGRIRRSTHSGAAIKDVVSSPLGSVNGMVIDQEQGKIYWTSTSMRIRCQDCDGGEIGTIRRSNVDGSGVEDLLVAKDTSPRGIALDPVEGRIYWTDVAVRKGLARIRRANLDGSGVEDIIRQHGPFDPVRPLDGGDTPWAIAIDAQARKIYWTTTFQDPTSRPGSIRLHPVVQRANLDGSNPEAVLWKANQSRIRSLALDPALGKLCWAEDGDADELADSDGTIACRDLAGRNVRVIATDLKGPVNIALDAESRSLFWSERSAFAEAGLLHRIGFDNMQRQMVNQAGPLAPSAIVVGTTAKATLRPKPLRRQPHRLP